MSEDTWSLWALSVVSLVVMCRLGRGHVKETIINIPKAIYYFQPPIANITKERLPVLYSMLKREKCSSLTLCIEIHH